MAFVAKIVVGAALGALAGLLIGRSDVCAAGRCRARPNRWVSLLAGALAGAALGYWWAGRG